MFIKTAQTVILRREKVQVIHWDVMFVTKQLHKKHFTN